VSASSCRFFDRKTTGEKIAEVNGKVLYLSDVRGIFPTGISAADSLQLLHSYVNNWARKQLVVQQAQQYLKREQKDVSRELEDYRTSLLIFRYEQMYLEQRLDTVVSDREIEAFYQSQLHNFILSKPVGKALLIKVPENLSTLNRIRQLYRSTRPEDQEELTQICALTAEKYTSYDEQWVDPDFLATELPLDSQQIEAEWSKGYLSVTENGYTYFVHLYEKALAGEPAPVEYEKDRIAGIVRNKRRQETLKNLENAIYKDALDRNQLKIYID
jgi:hypothetical protein